MQAGFKVAGDSGFYASIWGSNVEFAPETHASSELDFTVGWGKNLSDDWALDVNVLHYQLSVDHGRPQLDRAQQHGDLEGQLLGCRWAIPTKRWVMTKPASTRWSAPSSRSTTSSVSKRHSRITSSTTAVVAEDGYSHGQLSAIWAFKAPFEARLTAHATDSNAEEIFGDDFAGSRIEAAVQASF